MVYQNPNVGTFWRAFEWKMFVHFIVIWYIFVHFGISVAIFVFLWPFLYFYGPFDIPVAILVFLFLFYFYFKYILWSFGIYFSRFGMLYQEKSGNPASGEFLMGRMTGL
jgi:hypothetical protein